MCNFVIYVCMYVESMRRLGIWGERGGELYSERPGMADCAYYMRTGTCGYGSKCRYNHPPDRSSSVILSIAFVYFEFHKKMMYISYHVLSVMVNNLESSNFYVVICIIWQSFYIV